MTTYHATAEFKGARFHESDLSGVLIDECDARGLRIRGSWLDGVRLDSFAGELGSVLVEGVEVRDYVLAELDRRFPERVAYESMRTPDDHRRVWAQLKGLWTGMLDAAEGLPDEQLNASVDQEWSFLETARHLVFAMDTWIHALIRGQERPHHPLGVPMSDADLASLQEEWGLDATARPTLAEVRAVLEQHWAEVDEEMAALDDERMAVRRTAVFSPRWGEESRLVGEALGFILHEHLEHRRYALRDLPELAGPAS